MLKRSFIGVCSLLCAAIGFGQCLDELQHNPHIGWIAEVEHDWILDIPADTNYVLNDHNAARLQQWIQTPTLVEVLPNEFARSTILYAIQSGDLPIYQDPACTHALHYPDLVSQDTVYSCEEGIPFIIINPHEPADIYFFRVHQLIYYNTQTGRFGTTSISVAPILKKRDVEGNFISFEPLCWFKADNMEVHKISSKPNITLAIQTWSRSSANFLNMDTSAILKKQPQALEPCKHLFQLLISDISEKRRGSSTLVGTNWNYLVLNKAVELSLGRIRLWYLNQVPMKNKRL